MRYVFDNDLHIHSTLSSCSSDPAESTERILAYGVANHLKTLCLTDHFWDDAVPGASGWYAPQNLAHIREALPLPQADGTRFLFGCETELDRNCTLGISPEHYDLFDFIVIPTTHLHMNGFTCRGDESSAERAKLWVDRFDAVLGMDLPFHKVGIAHLTCELMSPGKFEEVLSLIPDTEMERLFAKAVGKGGGIELNFDSKRLTADSDIKYDPDTVLRPYRVAKKQGCKFYFASDAHHPADLDAEKENAERIIDMLELDESDKFIIK